MRIAYINADPGVPVFGTKGSSLHVREIIEGFLRTGAEVHLLASRLEGQKPAEWSSVHLHALPASAVVRSGEGEPSALKANSELRRALEKHPSRFDLIYERYSLWSFAAMEYAREQAIASVLEVNAPLIEEQKAYRQLSDQAGAEAARQRAFNASANILAVSDEVAGYVSDKIRDIEKIRVVPNAINPARFPATLAPTCPAPPGGLTVGFMGSLRPWHGLATLVEAFAQVHRASSRARLLVVGDGPEGETMTKDVGARGLTNATTFTGAIPAGAVPGYLASMDVAVAPYPQLPSFYFSPLKVYEYMAAGRAVVASHIGQLKTLIAHGINGWHVPAGDPDALARAIQHLSQDDALRQRLGKAARATVLQNHSWDQVVRRIFEMTGFTPAVQPVHNLTIQPG